MGYLRRHLESIRLAQAWSSIDSRIFSAVILQHVHHLWTIILQWEENCIRIPVYYRSDSSVMRIEAASPFIPSDPSMSLDQVLTHWVQQVDVRFPTGLLALANSFRDTIPLAWDHIFASEPDGDPYYTRDGRQHHGGNQTRVGDPEREGSRAWKYNVFEKIPGAPDSSRRRNKQCLEALKPFSKVPINPGEFIEICFGSACRGLKCQNPSTCEKQHMAARGTLRNSTRADLRQVHEWLARPEVKARIRLTDAVRVLACFR